MSRVLNQGHTQTIEQQPKNLFEEVLQKEYEKQVKNQQKQMSLSERIQKITGKTRQKLKLQQIDKGERFNKMLESMKGLDTFIDAKDRIQKLNALNNKQLMQQLDHYNAIKKYQIKEKEGMMRTLHQDKLFKELDQELDQQDQYQDNEYVRLELFDKITQLQQKKKKKNIDIRQYIKDKNLISKAEDLIKDMHRFSQKDEQSYEAIDKFISQQKLRKLANNNEQIDIFTQQQTSQAMRKIEESRRLKEMKEKEMREIMVQNTNKLIELAKDYGIQINEKHFFSNSTIYNQFKKRTEDLIKKIEEEAKQKFLLKQKKLKGSQEAKPHAKLRISTQIVDERMLKQKRILGHSQQKNTSIISDQERSPSSQHQKTQSLEQLPSITQFNKTTSSVSTQIKDCVDVKKMSHLRIDTISEEESPIQKSMHSSLNKSRSVHLQTFSQPFYRKPQMVGNVSKLQSLTPRLDLSRNRLLSPSDILRDSIQENVSSDGSQFLTNRKIKADYHKQMKLLNQEFENFYEKMEAIKQDLQSKQKEEEEFINKMEEEFDVMIDRYELKQKLRQLGFSAEEVDYALYSQIMKKKKNQQVIAKQLRNGKVTKYF